MTKATPARVVEMTLERFAANRKEIERLRTANASLAKAAQTPGRLGLRARLASTEAGLTAEQAAHAKTAARLEAVRGESGEQGRVIYQRGERIAGLIDEVERLRKAPSAGHLTSLTSTGPATVSVAGVVATLPAAIVAGQESRVTGTTTGPGAGCCPSWRWHDWAKMCEPVDQGGLGFYLVREYGVRGVVQFLMDSEELVVAEWYTDTGTTTIHRRGTPQRYGPCCATKEDVVEWLKGL